ncbi:MAG: Fe-S cluster assembly ATPase SufC [Balneolaceae bacterium]|nr:MAG: Fe-S cluster assembly ATPase SufC [Balneolaceae bacterium]
MLELKNLHAEVEGEGIEILKGVNLKVNKGEIHAIMGPNGSGKSTLAKVIAGHPEYEVTGGDIIYKGESILEMDPDERAHAGVFLAFQYPVEVPGVTNTTLLRESYNTIAASRGREELDPLEFDDYIREKLDLVEMNPDFLERSVNTGFSGGEKKRNEIFQMAVLQPTLSLLDETDSGLDIDALRIVSEGINKLHGEEDAVVLITHYQRLLNYIVPDHVHVMLGGKIVKSGGKELAFELEEKGYDWLESLAKVNGEAK